MKRPSPPERERPALARPAAQSPQEPSETPIGNDHTITGLSSDDRPRAERRRAARSAAREGRHPQDGPTPAQQAELAALFDLLGVTVRPDRRGTQTARCWSTQAHEHGDRHPSLRINLVQCVWYCHGCGIGGGLIDLREAAGQTTPDDTGVRSRGHGYLALLNAVALQASPDTDVVGMLPPNLVANLRARTGHYLKDSTLKRATQTLLAALVIVGTETDSTRGVRLSELDAIALGVTKMEWKELRPVLAALGIECVVGDSCNPHYRYSRSIGAGRGRGGAHAATTFTITPRVFTNLGYSTVMLHHTPSTTTSGVPQFGSERASAQQAARFASAAPIPDEGPGFHRMPSWATIAADMQSGSMRLPATGGVVRWVKPPFSLRVDLVERHGPGVPRHLLAMERAGLVQRSGRGAGAVAWLTPLCESVLERDEAAGRSRLGAMVAVKRDKWKDVKQRALECRVVAERDPVELVVPLPDDVAWVAHGGRLVDAVTGEFVAQADVEPSWLFEDGGAGWWAWATADDDDRTDVEGSYDAKRAA